MQISIIVLTYNSEKYITECLDAIIKSKDKQDELIVIDNNSKDSTVDLLKKYRKKAKIYLCNKNLGISEGRNFGIKQAKYDVLAFIDSDLIVNHDSLANAKESYLKNNAKALTGLYLEHGDGYNWFMEMRRILFDKKRNNFEGKFITMKNYTTFAGGFCLIDKETIIKYSGYNSKFNGSPSEDINLELRMLRDGVNIVFEKNFSGNHYKDKMSFSGLVRRFKLNGKAIARLLRFAASEKYIVPLNSVWPYLPIIVPLELLCLILSFINYLFIIPFIIMSSIRCYSVIKNKKYDFVAKLKFLVLRPFTDIVMFGSMFKELLFPVFVNHKTFQFKYTEMK